MKAAFLTIVNMSLCASWLILAIMILRGLVPKIPKWGCVFLWGLVALRLLVPFSVESRFSLIPNAMPGFEAAVTENMELGITEPAIPVVSDSAANTVFLSVFIAVWLTGVLLLLAYFVVSYWWMRRRLDTAVLLRENIYQSDRIHTPVVVGIFKPRICIPFRVEEGTINHIIAHEKTHICRGDHWWKLIGYFTLILHWFNPFVWIAYMLFGRDIEIACDNAVVGRLTREERADYAQALVMCSSHSRIRNAYPLYFGEVGVKTRVKSVMNYKSPTAWHYVLTAAFSILLMSCFLTNPVRVSGETVQNNSVPQPQAQIAERPVKDLTGIDLKNEPVRESIHSMQKELESLKLRLKQIQAQYEETEPKNQLPLEKMMDHCKRSIEELELRIQRAKQQIGME